jgi:hypothetical protein
MALQIEVALVVMTNTMSLSELSKLLGRTPHSGSHDKGAMHPNGSTWPITTWCQNSSDPTAPFDLQCAQLLNDMPPECEKLLSRLPDEISGVLDVAAYFETANFSLDFPRELLDKLSAKGLGIQLSAYPCGGK